LTRDLDLPAVLEQVAAAGQSLAQAEQARVWLGDTAGLASAATPGPMRLGAAVPAPADENSLQPPPAGSAITATSLVLPLIFQDQTIGVLELQGRADRAFTAVDVGLLQPFADTAAVAIQNARLYEQAGLSATLAERNRLARELHDTIAQGLTAVTMHLEAAQRSFDRYPDRARARLVRASELSRQTLADVRRSVWTLAAPLGDGVALPAALDDLVQNFATRTGLAATYTHSGPPPPLDAAAATQAVRIMQEALLNVEKHAQATTVTVQSETNDGAVRVSVQDDGQGFDPQAPPRDGSTGSGFGLFSLQERARLAGGHLQVQSAPGTGTQITLLIPRPAPGETAE
jgi:signal transduction histidine kinase